MNFVKKNSWDNMSYITITERKIQMKKNQKGIIQYSITLPNDWVEKNEFSKGDVLEWKIEPKKPGELLLQKEKKKW